MDPDWLNSNKQTECRLKQALDAKTIKKCRKNSFKKKKWNKKLSSLQPNSVHYSSAVPLQVEVSVWVIMGSSMCVQYKRFSYSLHKTQLFHKKNKDSTSTSSMVSWWWGDCTDCLRVPHHWESGMDLRDRHLGEGRPKIYVSSQSSEAI